MGDRSELLEAVSLGDIVQRIDDLHLVRLKGKNKEWEVHAKKAVVLSGEDDATVHEIGITYSPSSGSPVILRAEKGRYNINTNAFFIEKVERDVDIRIGPNLTINTGSLTWLDEKREVRSSGNILVRGERFILEGEDLEANIDSGVYEINRNIRAVMW